jgi:beta-phosphoglucomutase-like phosphatase (HAD superfamily)
MTQPSAALDDILAHTRHLLLDFNGPICDLYAGLPAAAMAHQLRRHLHTQEVSVPVDVAHTDDPIEVLAYSATIGPGLAAEVEAELSTLEVTAAASAVPSGYAPDLLVACRDSNRTVVVLSPSSARAVDDYLTRHDLDKLVSHVIARTGSNPDFVKPNSQLIELAVDTPEAESGTCTLLSSSRIGLESARLAGITSIGYASKPGDYEQLTAAGSDAIVLSLADLTLGLRAIGGQRQQRASMD